MNDHNLDDLIIGEPEGKGGKSKSVLTLLALILIILIVGTVLVKLITGGEEEVQSQESTELTSVVNPKMHSTQPKTKAPQEQIPEELKPIVEEKLPPLPKKKTAPAKPAASIKHEAAKKPAMKIEAASAKKKTEAPKKKTAPAAAKKQPAASTKQRSSGKPSELFKKTGDVKRTYYIQVGSFKRPPTQKFLDKIKANGYTPIIVKTGEMIKVRVGPYSSYEAAKAKLPEVKTKLGIAGFVVRKK